MASGLGKLALPEKTTAIAIAWNSKNVNVEMKREFRECQSWVRKMGYVLVKIECTISITHEHFLWMDIGRVVICMKLRKEWIGKAVSRTDNDHIDITQDVPSFSVTVPGIVLTFSGSALFCCSKSKDAISPIR